MEQLKLSRRSVLQASVGAVAVTATAGAAFAATEFEAMQARIGQRLSVHAPEGTASVVLEDVVRLGDPVRTPFSGAGRVPFAVVFRQEGGDTLEGGTHLFSSDGVTGDAILVSAHRSDDGAVRMEAVFN